MEEIARLHCRAGRQCKVEEVTLPCAFQHVELVRDGATRGFYFELEPPLPQGIAPLMQPFKGDLDGMVKRRMIRVLTWQA
jgi:hypothetical protein